METGMLDKKRLIVIVPGHLANDLRLAAQIHNIARRTDMDVLYLTLASDTTNMLELSHQMTTMRTVTKGTWIIVVSTIADIPSWSKTLRKIYRSHDLIVIASEQNVISGMLRPISVCDFLCSPLKNAYQTESKDAKRFPRKFHGYIARPKGVTSKSV